jgi:hypothetical protein
MLVDSLKLSSGRALSEAEKMQRERQRIGDLKGIVSYQWAPDGKAVLVPIDGDLFLAGLDGSVRKIAGTEGGELDPALSPKGTRIAFVRGARLFVGPVDGAVLPQAVTPEEASATVHWGEAEFVAQEEMNRFKGFWWAPDESRLAVQRFDEAGVGKGSGRSIPGIDLGAAVLAAKDMGLLVAGGGHAMAAGLTVAAGQVESFADFIEDRLSADVARASGDRALLLDVVVSCGGITPSLVEALEGAGPYGMGWPAPRVAAGPMRVIKADIVGSGGHVRALMQGDDGRSLKAVAFRSADKPLGQALLAAPRDRRLWVAGRAKIDDWGTRPAAELHLDDAAWCD